MPVDVWKRMTVTGAILVIATLVLTVGHGFLSFWHAYLVDGDPVQALIANRIAPYPAWLAVTLIAIVAAAVVWARASRGLVIAALVTAGVALVSLLGFGVARVATLWIRVGEWAAVAEFVWLVAAMILPVVSMVALARLLVMAAAKTAAPALPAAAPEPAVEAGPASGAPVWQPDQAAGAHWQTAGAAAAGAAAQNWGRPGERGGWGPRVDGPAPAGALPPGPGQHVPDPHGPGLHGPDPHGPGPYGPGQQGPGPDPHGAGQQGPGLPPVPSGGYAQGGRPPQQQPVAPDQPVHQPLPPEAFGPQALGQQFGSAHPAEATQITPPGRRQPPRWTPLDRSPE